MPRRILRNTAALLTLIACVAMSAADAQDGGRGRARRNARQSVNATQESGKALEGFSAVQALEIVDCLLPGQVRVVGGRTYLTPRRPTRTTAADCGARGGEYLAYDRADYRSALNVWLPTAEQGDAEAQTMVGEIYERGLGAEPNYEAAAEWYKKAADQGYARAEFDLGTLYEQGHGVPANRLEALNWYRKAWGLPEDSLIFRSAAAAEQSELRAQLEQQIEQRNRQIDALEGQVKSLQQQLSQRADAAQELESLQTLLAQLQAQSSSDQQRLDAMPTLRSAGTSGQTTGGGAFKQAKDVEYKRKSFGRYYALIIGVQDYEHLDDLESPLNDAREAAMVLEEKYGFSVKMLTNPDQLTVMKTVNELNDTLTEDDNLLIYFAGHGSRLQTGSRETGYWLPTNAEPAPDDTLWVPNEFVSRHLGRIKAKRVLVVSDSCYAGLLGDDPGYVMVGDGQYTDEYIEWKMPKRSRLVLASGGDQPVLDNGGNGHSVFAHAFLETLESNDRVLTAPELFLKIRSLVEHSPLAS
ncbi:MAG TPA: caspase family protein, partial [Gammaproteobacteria bacterium]|nr:caspase family protein [Gammaproteobacteria bacterium]